MRRSAADVTIRPAIPGDADGIARIFLESAEHHARLDPARYGIPSIDAIFVRYRDGQQHTGDAGAGAITLIAELNGEIVGFVDVRLHKSEDPMHRELLYCTIVEIAVARAHQNQGIGGQLLQAAESWGRERGAHLASLEYLAENTGASRFYEAGGYRAAHITAVKHL